jgi:hypothetical protein
MKTASLLLATLALCFFGAPGLKAQSTFVSATPIVINDSTNPPAKASPYPAVLTVAGLSGLVDSVSVTLSNVHHTFPDDIGMLLVGPQGQSVALMANAGGGGDITNVTMTFSDFAAAPVSDGTTVTSGGYKPSIYGNPGWPAPAPGGPHGTNLSIFHGTDPNGLWSLFVLDDATSDNGGIAGGWRLTITTAQNPAPVLANVSLTPVLSENGFATLSGNIVDSNPSLGFALSVNWGDAVANQNLSFPAGATSFVLTHRYLDDGQKGTPLATYKVGLTVTDSTGVSDDGFLSAAFNDLLGHSFDPEQGGSYENKIVQFGRSNFSYDLLTSLEYRGRKVQDYYQQFLHHAASAGDETFIAGGPMKEREIVSFILASTDYFQNRANNDNTAWIDSVYYDLLHRAASAAEKSTYLAFIVQNGRGPAADSILASAEFRQLQVETWFQKFLHHTGGASEPPFVASLSNQTWEQVLALLLGSADYYNGRSGGTASVALGVAVANVPPSMNNLGIGSPIVEGGITSLSGQFSDPGSQDACTLKINWGDGSPLQTLSVASGQNSFNVAHLYSVPHTTNLVQLTMSDDDGGTVTSNLTVIVKERLPMITAIARQPGSITRLSCSGVPSRTYTVQASSSLSNPTNWVNLGGATASANGTFTTYDMAPGNALERFYRLRSP